MELNSFKSMSNAANAIAFPALMVAESTTF